MDTCYYCKWKSNRVEAGGIYYCPNAYCPGPGGAWFRYTLNSYKEDKHCNRHTVSECEYYWKAMKYMYFQMFKKWFGLKHNL
jgi:hypothetical protein